MSGVLEIRDHLLSELELAVRTSESLINRIKPEEWTYTPQENMRTLQQLVHHLVSIPASDLAILQEKEQPEVEAVENRVQGISDPEQLSRQLRENFESFKVYITGLTEEELLRKSTKAFYLDHGMVQSKWLIEVVTHMFHHRSQLFNYLKQLGHDINFFLLYA
ncbi:DinB family protein [Paenibacillus sp. FJAT-26967]|uniref:DinB family protein n=1 Tax=Paenibacillus sp. FJAT-26967 TaxID=1729690 RepID=UPI000837F81F|nr:DinB family protein [Paenibacillus sp. FJAT-26967]